MPIEIPRLTIATAMGRGLYLQIVDEFIQSARGDSAHALEVWAASANDGRGGTLIVRNPHVRSGRPYPEITFACEGFGVASFPHQVLDRTG